MGNYARYRDPYAPIYGDLSMDTWVAYVFSDVSNPRVPERIKQGFRLYITDGYTQINRSARRSIVHPQEIVRDSIQGMLEWFDPGQYRHGPMQQLREQLVATGYIGNDLLVYRGIKLWCDDFVQNNIMTDGGFVSTTLDLQTAMNFCSGPYSMLLIIHVPWTTRVYIPYLVDSNELVKESGESSEIIFPPSTRFQRMQQGTLDIPFDWRVNEQRRYIECSII